MSACILHSVLPPNGMHNPRLAPPRFRTSPQHVKDQRLPVLSVTRMRCGVPRYSLGL